MDIVFVMGLTVIVAILLLIISVYRKYTADLENELDNEIVKYSNLVDKYINQGLYNKELIKELERTKKLNRKIEVYFLQQLTDKQWNNYKRYRKELKEEQGVF